MTDLINSRFNQPIEAITTAVSPGAALSAAAALHFVTIGATEETQYLTLADGAAPGERHKLVVISSGPATDLLYVTMTMAGTYEGIRTASGSGSAARFDSFEVVWDGTYWWPLYVNGGFEIWNNPV